MRAPKQLVAGTVIATGAAGTYYTVPSNTATTISACTIINTSSSAVEVTLYIVPTGGSASTSNCILYSYSISSGGGAYVAAALIGHTMPAGTMIKAIAGSANATLFVSGYEQT